MLFGTSGLISLLFLGSYSKHLVSFSKFIEWPERLAFGTHDQSEDIKMGNGTWEMMVW